MQFISSLLSLFGNENFNPQNRSDLADDAQDELPLDYGCDSGQRRYGQLKVNITSIT